MTLLSFWTIALLLGMRHGLDLDHLAMIDSITRKLSQTNKTYRFVGLFFSLGHGLVVMLGCLLLNVFFNRLVLPTWLEKSMVSLSIILLIVFGSINLYSLFKQKKVMNPVLTTKKSTRFAGYLSVERPYSIMLIGAIFAISFDTFSQLTLFSLNLTYFHIVYLPILLGLAFMLGMILTDGLNGFLISYLINKATKLSLTLAKCFTLMIGLFSTLIGFYEMMTIW